MKLTSNRLGVLRATVYMTNLLNILNFAFKESIWSETTNLSQTVFLLNTNLLVIIVKL